MLLIIIKELTYGFIYFFHYFFLYSLLLALPVLVLYILKLVYWIYAIQVRFVFCQTDSFILSLLYPSLYLIIFLAFKSTLSSITQPFHLSSDQNFHYTVFIFFNFQHTYIIFKVSCLQTGYTYLSNLKISIYLSFLSNLIVSVF